MANYSTAFSDVAALRLDLRLSRPCGEACTSLSMPKATSRSFYLGLRLPDPFIVHIHHIHIGIFLVDIILNTVAMAMVPVRRL
jgi:hypothetical protein